jgi:quercetin dioxygenase-like cupin family protein
MRKTIVFAAIAIAIALAWSIGYVEGQGKSLIFVESGKGTFKEAVPGVSKVSLWGDETKGAYGSLTKFKPGFDAGMHHHTNDLWIFVHKGAYLYKDADGEKRVGPGSFIFVPGGTKHWSGGDKKEGALFYEESSGSFDLVPEK